MKSWGPTGYQHEHESHLNEIMLIKGTVQTRIVHTYSTLVINSSKKFLRKSLAHLC